MINTDKLISQIPQESVRVAQMIDWRHGDPWVTVVTQKRFGRVKRKMTPLTLTLTGNYVKHFYLSREGVIYDGNPDEVCNPVRFEVYSGSDLLIVFNALSEY